MTIAVLRPELYFAEITETTDTLSGVVISLSQQIYKAEPKAVRLVWMPARRIFIL